MYSIIIVMITNYTLNFLFSPFIFVFNLLYLLVGSNMSPVQFIYLLKQTKEQFPLQRVKGGDSISLKKVKLVNKHKATTLHFSFLSSSFLFLIYYLFLFLVFLYFLWSVVPKLFEFWEHLLKYFKYTSQILNNYETSNEVWWQDILKDIEL